ncbi:MAG: TlpA family protein disulfide reductase [Myxococcales bacterium]|nr:TlpA family protein disulfide reductase [Myxococcales bacterium]
MWTWLVAAAWAAPEMIPEDVFRAVLEAAKPEEGAVLDVQLPLREGGTFVSTEARGKPLLLAFWASWCGPCRAELPALAVWAKEHPDVTVLAVNVDRDRAPAERFIKGVSFELPTAFDPDGHQLGSFGVESMPTTLLFDRQHQLSWRHTGYSTQRGFTELDAALPGAMR